MSSPAAVIFDNDGLLLDTELAWTRAERRLFAAHGARFTAEHKRSLLGSSHDVAAAKLEAMLRLPGRGPALMGELHTLVMEEALQGVPPRPGVPELLRRLAAAGTPLALASNSPLRFVQRTLSCAGVPEATFAAVVCAEHVAQPKPAPDVYLEAARRLGVQPSACAALEDSPPGVAAAVAAGMHVIGVPYLPGETLPGAHLLAASLADPRVGAALGLLAASALR